MLELTEPFFPRYPCLPEQSAQKSGADVAFMGIGNDQREITPRHLRMLSTTKRSGKAKLVQSVSELTPGNRRQLRHAQPPRYDSD